MEFYFAKGMIKYKGEWIIIEVPHSIVNYYKWFVEKHLGKKISTSYHGSHVTLLAGKHERGLDKHPLWKKHHEKEISFKYYSYLHTDNRWFTQGQYFWLQIETPMIAQIRTELGLKPNLKWTPHLTIGYCGY